jgi:hypothetical protein
MDENPFLFVCWVDLDIFMPYELLHCLYFSLASNCQPS